MSSTAPQALDVRYQLTRSSLNKVWYLAFAVVRQRAGKPFKSERETIILASNSYRLSGPSSSLFLLLEIRAHLP